MSYWSGFDEGSINEGTYVPSNEQIQQIVKNNGPTDRQIEEIESRLNFDYGSVTGDSGRLANLDFFKLFGGLPEFNSNLNNYCGFMPIVIKNARFSEEYNTSIDTDTSTKINIKIPWSVHEISDSVSVSFSRRGDTQISYPEVLGSWASQFGGEMGQELVKMVIATYNAKDLQKSLDLEFILPLTKTRNLSSNFPQEAREALGSLQGLCYPRGFGFLYPPLLKVIFGGLYIGFKGFLKEVSIRSSEEMIDLGGYMWPLIIKGNLRFVNVFMYSWSETIPVPPDFNLSINPSLLFGLDKANTISNTKSGENPPSKITNLPNFSENNSPVPMNLFKRLENLSLKSFNQESLNTFSDLTKKYFENINESGIGEFDFSLSNEWNNRLGSLLNEFNDNMFSGFGIDSSNPSVGLANNLYSVLGSVQHMYNYSYLIKNIKDGNLVNSIVSLTRVIGDNAGFMGESLKLVLDILRIGSTILKGSDLGYDFQNIAFYYENLNELLNAVNSISNANDLQKNNYVNTLKSEKLINTSNSIVENINFSINAKMIPLASIYNATNALLLSEILKNNDKLTLVNNALYEKGYALYSNNKINRTIMNNLEQLKKVSDNISIDEMSALNEEIFSTLLEVYGGIDR